MMEQSDPYRANREYAAFLAQHKRPYWTPKQYAAFYETHWPYFFTGYAFLDHGAALQALADRIDAHPSAELKDAMDVAVRSFHDLFETWLGFCQLRLEERQARARSVRQAQRAGAKGKGVARRHGHDWEAICADYDKRMSEGKPRATITYNLAEKYTMDRSVLARGLRARGRGASAS